MGKLTDGYGNEIPVEWLKDHLLEYVPFKDAAPMIDPLWTRHHLHKELQMGRVFRGELLVLHDDEIISPTGWSKGTRMYITRKEVERIQKEYDERPKRTIRRCTWCKRQLRVCRKSPCQARIRSEPEFQQTVEKVAT